MTYTQLSQKIAERANRALESESDWKQAYVGLNLEELQIIMAARILRFSEFKEELEVEEKKGQPAFVYTFSGFALRNDKLEGIEFKWEMPISVNRTMKHEMTRNQYVRYLQLVGVQE
jgi:hypothetical protein